MGKFLMSLEYAFVCMCVTLLIYPSIDVAISAYYRDPIGFRTFQFFLVAKELNVLKSISSLLES